MANDRLTEISKLVYQQLEYQEALSYSLAKAEALAYVTMCQEFLDMPNNIIQDYLWALSDIIEQAKAMNYDSLNSLYKLNGV
jgi:hypothetical protein